MTPLIFDMPVLKPIQLNTGDGWFNAVKSWIVKSRKFKLVEDYIFTLPSGVTIFIPAGFIFDGASIPRFLWPVLNPFGILLIAGLIHDFGYKYQMFLTPDYGRIFVGKKQSVFDKIFLDVGEYTNGLKIIDKIAYGALRAFGWMAWNKHRKANVKPYWQMPFKVV